MRYIVKIYGIVQGIGFRPFIYNKANEFKINGYVKNIGGAVLIDCSGERENIKQFMFHIIKKPPELAKIEKVQCIPIKEDLQAAKNINKGNFVIKESNDEKNTVKIISQDIGTCPKCLEDIKKKGTSRFKYAFTNCTQCGPRYSITKALPYDRENTTMDDFTMCDECKKEYDNPNSRRFHAQPNCCKKCGPELFLMNNEGEYIKCEDPVKETIKFLEEGKILAIKGI